MSVDLDREGEGAAPSMVTSHAFVSRSGEWWDLCVCGLSSPAHERAVDLPVPDRVKDFGGMWVKTMLDP